MSSGKPQTRGLAALLRIEKERRAREEAGAEEESSPESIEDRPGPREVVAPPREPEPAAESVAPNVSADESAGGREHESANPGEGGAVALTSGTVAEAAESTPEAPPAAGAHANDEGTQHAAAVPFPAPPSPRPRRTSPKTTGASRKGAGAPTVAPQAADPGWEKFAADWKPFLRQGIKFKLCEFFYRNTVALGRREFITSTAQLSRVSGAHRRHIFLVLRQLEDLRFIRKESVETNRKDEGLVISFFPDRQA